MRSALDNTGLSTILPPTVTTAPSRCALAAITIGPAQLLVGGRENAIASSTCLGWMQSFPPSKISWLAGYLDARPRCHSRPSSLHRAAVGSEPAVETSTSCERKYARESSSPSMPKSTCENLVPAKARRSTVAVSVGQQILEADRGSTRGMETLFSFQTHVDRNPPGKCSDLGIMKPRSPGCDASSTSLSYHAVSQALIRTHTGRSGVIQSAAAFLAASFWAGATASLVDNDLIGAAVPGLVVDRSIARDKGKSDPERKAASCWSFLSLHQHAAQDGASP